MTLSRSGPCLLALALAGPAAAQSRPPALPTRDVAVTYQVSGAAAQSIPGGVPGALVLHWDAAGRRLRLDAEGRPQSLVVDLPEHRAVLLDAAMHGAINLPMRERDAQLITLDGARLTRRGQDVVAGQPCTDYAVQHPRGTGTVCLTADGVPLRARGVVDGKEGAFTATAVEYASQSAALFQPPPGFLNLDIARSLGLNLGRSR